MKKKEFREFKEHLKYINSCGEGGEGWPGAKRGFDEYLRRYIHNPVKEMIKSNDETAIKFFESCDKKDSLMIHKAIEDALVEGSIVIERGTREGYDRAVHLYRRICEKNNIPCLFPMSVKEFEENLEYIHFCSDAWLDTIHGSAELTYKVFLPAEEAILADHQEIIAFLETCSSELRLEAFTGIEAALLEEGILKEIDGVIDEEAARGRYGRAVNLYRKMREDLRVPPCLYSGIFWIITDGDDESAYEFLVFKIPYDAEGNGRACDHKELWESKIKNNAAHERYNEREFDYFPRGRVEISAGCANIYLAPDMTTYPIIGAIAREFGVDAAPDETLVFQGISDPSLHYQCRIDQMSALAIGAWLAKIKRV